MTFMWNPRENSVVYLHHTTECPHVRFTSMPLLIEDFRRQVVWGSTYCSSTVLQRLELCSQTKVSNLELHRLIDEKVTWEEQQNYIYIYLNFIQGTCFISLYIPLELNPWFWHCCSHIWACLPSLRSLCRISCSWRYFNPETICRR